MKSNTHCNVIILIITTQLLFAGCSRATVGDGKWLDYGNGLINLNQVTSITIPFSSAIKFDNFTLSMEDAPAVKATMEKIREFLRGNESYLKLAN